MNKETGSLTAVGAAMLRAAHQLIDGTRLIDDPVILKLLGSDAKDHIINTPHNFFVPGTLAMRTHIVLRSRYAEDCLANACKNGVKQFLILGAGLDTFAYRQPGWAKNIQIIEADHPTSQADKLNRLNKAGIIPPQNLSFVKIDLETDELLGIFKESKLDLSKPIFTTCLGVLIYLTQNAVDKIFRFLGGLPPGSEFFFTASQKRDGEWPGTLAEWATAVGESWLTYFEPDELIPRLKACGFIEASFLTPEEAKKLYFEGNDVHLPPPARSSIVRAMI